MQWFIVPSLDGPVSGGTLYNRLLTTALKDAGCACEVLPIEGATAVSAQAAAGDDLWVDSLYLDHLPRLARATRSGARLGLIVHYLPSLISHGENISQSDLTSVEVAALHTASMFLVPSTFMRGLVCRLTGDVRPVLQVEPGRPLGAVSSLPEPPARALVVANLVPGKGVAPFLASLAEQIRETDALQVSMVGGAGHDPAYAEHCHAIARDPRLRGRACFLGELPHDETLRTLASSNLLVSCSHMESYGMALMEARVLGVPILAKRGGHVAAMVGRDAGGEVFADATDLVASLLRICRDPGDHRRRMELARARALPARPWSAAALEFVAHVANSGRAGWREAMAVSQQEGLHGVG
jgi:glycosyltransferase involved in cell wall biosynthesis